MANMASRLSGEIILTLHGPQAPTAAEWNSHLTLLSRAAIENGNSLARCRSLVFSDGGMPDSAQRKASTRVIDGSQGNQMKIAMVTTSALVRGVITAGHWFGLKMQAFAPNEFDKALAFLALSGAESQRIRRDLEALSTAVSCRAYGDIRW